MITNRNTVRECMETLAQEERSGKGTRFHALLRHDDRYQRVRKAYDVVFSTESPKVFIQSVEDFMVLATSLERELRTEGLLDRLVDLQRGVEAYAVWVELRK